MREEKACGPQMGKSYSYRELPIGATSIGIHDDVIKTGTWRTLRPAFKVKTPPCNEGCPAGVDVRGFVALMKQGLFHEAYTLYLEENPLPGVCGRVCYHPCESACNRKDFDQPVNINALERFMADFDSPLEPSRPEKGKHVAMVGSGPSGLSCSYFLARLGYRVTILEAQSKAGGMMRYGIPRYRLPEDLLDREIRGILQLGVEFRGNQKLGEDFTLEQLRRDGYDAVFLGVGAQLNQRVSFEGSDLPDVLWGIDFLSRVADGEKIRLKDRVIVIGGGNVAIDVALTAMRCGAHKVTVVCVERREEMPAHEWQIQDALSEGVQLMTSWGPHRVVSGKGQLKGMELIQCTSVFDGQGVFNPEFSDTKERIEGDQVIMAIGQSPDLSFLGDRSGIEVTGGLIVVDQGTLQTGIHGVYAGGDVIDQPRSVVHAIGSGKRAAFAIERYFMQQPGLDLYKDLTIGQEGGISYRRYVGDISFLDSGEVVRFEDLNADYFQYEARHEKPKVAKEERKGFQELYGNLTPENAVTEAQRCFSCGLCDHCGNCYIFCPDGSVSEQEGGPLNVIDYEYCKGCGICANECPIGIIEMEKEG
jgi:formate dehydrogenase beta subunit